MDANLDRIQEIFTRLVERASVFFRRFGRFLRHDVRLGARWRVFLNDLHVWWFMYSHQVRQLPRELGEHPVVRGMREEWEAMRGPRGH